MTGDIPHIDPDKWRPDDCLISPFEEGGSIEDRIDEIRALGGRVHIEMMDNKNAWMRIGDEVFWINCRKGGLFIRWEETRPGYSPPLPEPPKG